MKTGGLQFLYYTFRDMQETLKKLEQDSLAEGNSEVDELLADINGESNRDSTKS